MSPEPSEEVPFEDLPARLRFEKLVKGSRKKQFEPFDPGDMSPGDLPEPPPIEAFPARTPPTELDRRVEAARQRAAGPAPAAETSPGPEASPAGAGSDHVEDGGAESEVSHKPLPRSAEAGADHVQDGQADAGEEKKSKKVRSFWVELPILVLVALIVAIIIKTFFFQAFYIPSGSMIPTLEVNDRVLVNKLSYQFGEIERGDILVFHSPDLPEPDRGVIETVVRAVGESTGIMSPDTVLIKRVIGLPGDMVAIRENHVYVNDNPIAEPYLPSGPAARMNDMAAVQVPEDHVFLMGDNRIDSKDSRQFGPVHRDDVVGRAFVTIWPPGRWRGL
jgi:signal peptidase I